MTLMLIYGILIILARHDLNGRHAPVSSLDCLCYGVIFVIDDETLTGAQLATLCNEPHRLRFASR